METQNLNESFAVNPNPTSGEVMVTMFSNTNKVVVFELCNAIGKTFGTL